MLSLQRSNNHHTPWFARPVSAQNRSSGSQGTGGNQRSLSPISPDQEDEIDFVVEETEMEPSLYNSEMVETHRSVFRNRYPPLYRKKTTSINANSKFCDESDLPLGEEKKLFIAQICFNIS